MSTESITGFKLSPQQERLWQWLGVTSGEAFGSACLVSIKGVLDAERLVASLERAVAKHEILRTGFRSLPGMEWPLQVIHPHGELHFERRALTHIDHGEEGETLDRLFDEFRRRSFALEEGKVLRALLVSLSSSRHALLLSLPALCADGRGLSGLVCEIWASYSASTVESVADELVQYADLAEIFRHLLESEETASGRRYWRELDLESSPEPRLPYQKSPTSKKFEIRSLAVEVPGATLAAIELLPSRRDLGQPKAEAFLLACWEILLWRLISRNELVIGIVRDGRTYEGLERAIGLFCRYLPMRSRCERSASFVESYQRVDAWLSEVDESQDYFDWRDFQPDAGSDDPFLLPFCFAFLDESADFSGTNVAFKVTERYGCCERFKIQLSCYPGPGGLVAEFGYDPSCFDRGDISRLASEMLALMDSAAGCPGESIECLSMVGEAERRLLLSGFNDTRSQWRESLNLFQLFETQAQRGPERIALMCEGEDVRYGELARRCERLACRLRRFGVGPGVPVALCVERSVNMVVAMLAILKAGGAYVPLDPEYPKKRLAWILSDLKVPLILVDGSGSIPEEGSSASILRLQDDALEDLSPQVSSREVSPDDLAYVIYTSGSTGKPKGVMVSHRAITNRLLWMRRKFRFDAGEIFMQKTPSSFDASVWEIFFPLMIGARLLLARPGGHRDGAYLVRQVREAEVTVLQLVPTMLRVFLDEPGVGELNSLRHVFCGGEAMSGELVERCFSLLDAELHNLYGPTESSIDATSWDCVRGVRGSWVPIGKPIDNVVLQILDEELQLLPVGAQGELMIGGIGLARGYHARARLTAELFVPDPYPTEAGNRLYKTGDLARWHPDGVVEFLGRRDQQIKLRGVRVELGEIESAVLEHPDVSAAVILLREDRPEDQRLIAYVVSHRAAALETGQLRSFVADSLPAALVPSDWVLLPDLPTLPNGKLDRESLPMPQSWTSDSEEARNTPAKEIEEILAGMWSEVLGRETVTPHDNVFDLGAHSLLATQLVSRFRQTFRVELSLRQLFQTPTVAGLAEHIRETMGSDEALSLPPIEAVAREGRIPLSFAQQRLWFLDQLQPDNSAYNLPMAVRLHGNLSVGALTRSLERIIERHEVLRTTFSSVDGEPEQIIRDGLDGPILPYLDLSALPDLVCEAEIQRLTRETYRAPMDLQRGPLLRILLIRRDQAEHVLVATLHHIISDAWSSAILVREMTQLYQGFAQSRPAALPEVPIQYADFAFWQRRWLQGEVLDSQLIYWRQQLAGAPPILGLPTDRPRPEIQRLRGANRFLQIPEALTEALKTLAREQTVSLFMVLLGAFKVLLHQRTGDDDIVVGTDVANRNRLEIEPLIGFFINQLVLRTDVGGDPTFGELLSRLREVCLGAYAHQDVPFEMLIDALGQERSLQHAPFFQVKLMLDNTPVTQGEVATELTMAPQPIDVDSAKLDLVLFMSENPHGMGCEFNYSVDLFDGSTIERLMEHFKKLLERVVSEPEVRLSRLEKIVAEEDRMKRTMATRRRRATSFDRFVKAKPKPRTLPTQSLVEQGRLALGQPLPLVMTPAVPDVDLVDWAASNQQLIEDKLIEHGAILFRGFAIDTAASFESFARVTCGELFNENGEHPRDNVMGDVYTPVFYPPDQKLLWHNENSFNLSWPRKILFGCLTPAAEGGETPIVDSREVFRKIDVDLRRRFQKKNLMYVRNYSEHLGLPWQTVFQVEDRRAAERYCDQQGLSIEWKTDDRAKTRAVRPAVARHPKTGEMSWFNQAQHFHVSCLAPKVRESLETLFSEDDLPRHCYYGDGTIIEDSVMTSILDAYRELEVVFAWQRGDILMLDNILVAHGRNPFVGDRKIVVALGEMTSYREI